MTEPGAHDYDLVVVGSGPAGQKAAIQAAKLRRRVALVERRRVVGGSCVNTGTIPSKTIREAILYLTGLSQRSIYGAGYRLKDEISVDDLATRTRYVVERERTRSPRSATGQDGGRAHGSFDPVRGGNRALPRARAGGTSWARPTGC